MLDVIIGIIFFVFVFTMGMSLIILRFTLDRRVRRLLPENWEYNAITDCCWGLSRASTFGVCAIFKNTEKSEFIKYSYNAINVYKLANCFEKVIAYLMLVSAVSAFSMAFIILPVCDWYGWTRFEIWEGLGVVPGYLR